MVNYRKFRIKKSKLTTVIDPELSDKKKKEINHGKRLEVKQYSVKKILKY